MSSFKSADALDFNGGALIVTGNFKAGKTVLAHTASAFAPNPLNAKTKTTLTDLAVIQLEPNGVRSAVSLGLVAANVLDLSGPEFRRAFEADAELTAAKGGSNELGLDFLKVMPALIKAAEHIKSHPEIKVVVFDHLTRFDAMVESHYRNPKYAPKTNRGEVDTFGIFRMVKEAHQWLAQLFFGTGVLFIGICQVKTPAKEADENKLAAKAIGGDNTDLVLALPQASAGFWAGYADAVIATRRKKTRVGTEDKTSYRMMLTSSQRFPSGNRFGLEGEHDSHLGPIIKNFYQDLRK